MKLYESGEMYLETILELKKEKGNVRAVDIVNAMGYAKSSVSEGLKLLKLNGFVVVDNDGLINLTAEGEKVAKDILSKHLVLTTFLEDLGVDPSIAEKDACKIEHIISDETFDAIKNKVEKN